MKMSKILTFVMLVVASVSHGQVKDEVRREISREGIQIYCEGPVREALRKNGGDKFVLTGDNEVSFLVKMFWENHYLCFGHGIQTYH